MTLRTPYYLIDERRLQHNLEIVGRVRDESGAKSVLALKCFSTWGVFESDAPSTSTARRAARCTRRASAASSSARRCTPTASPSDRRRGRRGRRRRRQGDLQLGVAAASGTGDRVGGLPLGLRVNPGVSYSHFDLADPARQHSRLGVTDDAELRARRRRPARADVPLQLRERGLRRPRAPRSTSSPTATPTCSTQMEWISLGGGISFTTPGYPVDRFCALLRDLADRFGVQVYLEPGEACDHRRRAELVTTVLDVVHNEVDIAVVDASIEAHMLDHLIYGTHPRVDAPAGRAITRSRSPAAPASPATCSASTRSTQPLERRRRGPLRRRRRLHDGQDHVVQRAARCRRSSSAAWTASSRSCASSGTTISERSLS